MDNNSYFNIAVCMMGILILLIHAVNVIIKKQKQKDEWILLDFFLFTIAHFAAYLTFTLLKARGSSDLLVMGFYTAFYIMNNLEVFLLFRYARAYIPMPSPTEKVLSALNYTVFSVYIALDIANIFTGIFFTAVDGVYTRHIGGGAGQPPAVRPGKNRLRHLLCAAAGGHPAAKPLSGLRHCLCLHHRGH